MKLDMDQAIEIGKTMTDVNTRMGPGRGTNMSGLDTHSRGSFKHEVGMKIL